MAITTTNHAMQKCMLCPDVLDKRNGRANGEGKKYYGRVVFVCVLVPISGYGV